MNETDRHENPKRKMASASSEELEKKRQLETVFDIGSEDKDNEGGQLESVNQSDAQNALLLCRGRLLLGQEGLYAHEPNEVVEMLTELGLLDIAIEIGLSLKLPSSAYCLSKMIEVFKSKNKENLATSVQWNKESLGE